MVEYLSDFDVITQRSARWLPYTVRIGCNLASLAPVLTTGPDEECIVPDDWPRPADGRSLGMVNGGVDIDPGSQLKVDEPLNGEILSNQRSWEGGQRTISFQLVSSAEKDITDVFEEPGPSSECDKFFGGDDEAVALTLVIGFADTENDGVFLFLILFDVTAIPQKRTLAPDTREIINAQFQCFPADDLDDPGCLRQVGTQVGRWLWVNSAGQPINRKTMQPIDPNASNKSFPAVNMVGGMIG